VTAGNLRRLAGLLEARKARDLARLEALIAEDRRLEAEIAGLAGTVARDLETGIAVPLAQQALRQAWADQRIRAARRRRAEIAALIRDARAAAARSLGKHESLESLVARADRAALQLSAARAEREAPPLPKPRD
jgi:hypothetical protein